MAKIGYARVSTKEQNLDSQIDLLKDCSKIFIDKMSGKDTERPQLQAMLDFIREGDLVVVAALDRLGRNNKDLTNIMNQIHEKGATLEILNLPSLAGIQDENLRRLLNNLILELFKYQAEAERTRIKERQRAGVEIAKNKGKFRGKKFKYTDDDPQLLHAFELFKEGHTDKDIERICKISARTFRRYRQRAGITREKYPAK